MIVAVFFGSSQSLGNVAGEWRILLHQEAGCSLHSPQCSIIPAIEAIAVTVSPPRHDFGRWAAFVASAVGLP
jgi:hypothetical protein